MQEPIVFRHIVGKSTLKEGITVRKDFEDWFGSPEIGSKREISLIYDKDKVISAILRRLNNREKHVQIKYETARYSQFREWLQAVFKESIKQATGEILEFHKVSKDEYLLKPLTLEMVDGTNLRISKTIYHGGAENVIPYIPAFKEVSQVINEVDFRVGKTQLYYNQKLKEGFTNKGWSTEKTIIEGFNLRYDHRKGNVQIEVEFGNARSYYQDYIKFSIAFNEGLISLGGLITPTADFANILCEIGREKAWQKVKQQGLVRKPTYSGMMTYEKAEWEFRYLKFMLNMPIIVMGIDYKD
jgi:hypothetical protein